MDKFKFEHGIEIIAEPNTQNICEYLDKVQPDELAGWVYALEYGGCVKIGCTTNLVTRIGALRSQARYGGMSIGRLLLSNPCANYNALETECHHQFSDSRVDKTELFRLTIEDVMPMFISLEYDSDYDKVRRRLDAIFNGMKSLVTGRLGERESVVSMSDFMKMYDLLVQSHEEFERMYQNCKRLESLYNKLYGYCDEWKKRYENAMKFIENNIYPQD